MTEDRALAGHRLRLRLRAHREAARLSQNEVAIELGWSPSKVHRIEKGTSPLTDDDLQRLLTLYDVDSLPEVERLRQMAGISRRPAPSREFRDILPASVRRFIDFESAARRIWTFEPALVPGLLQTADYTRALLKRVSRNRRDPDAVERAVSVRAHRQRILDEADPVKLDVLIDESVIVREVGGVVVMRRQLEHLWAMSERPNISLGIIPFREGAYPEMRTPFAVMRFRDPEQEDLLFLEDPLSEVITLGGGEVSAPQPSSYLAAYEEISALTDRRSSTAQRLKRALRELNSEGA